MTESLADAHPAAADEKALLVVDRLTKHFPIRRGVLQRQVGAVKAVDGVSFSVRPGETLGLVGESGCGKSTTGRVVTKLLDPTSGSIVYDGVEIGGYYHPDMTRVGQAMRPSATLNAALAQLSK